ncbi:Glucan endo-1,3-beta-glucosidase 4 [Sesamum angolense]|uniref:Glucan endo-1,3-beta-glucosidase 4 n=1 Tax=Sesamum angolense TaxID=2727404 RepID=A0AAE1WP13_9LAMI|nr:Glucan endo-1,3-beta-glucosidase 4 [Sesamum angolense]
MTASIWFQATLLLCGLLFNAVGSFVGINIGTDVSNLPSAVEIVAILRAHSITHVRLFNADARMLNALSNTGIEVMVSVTNEEVTTIGESPSAAADWINKNVAAYVPTTNITAIAVGSEVLTSLPNASAVIVPAMNYLNKALVASNLNYLVKSNGIFPLEYALFKPLPSVKQIVDPNTLFHYSSMFDALVDAAYNSIAALNFSGIPVVVTETGWPWSAGANEPDATAENAETYNKNLIRRVANDTGPPSQPAVPINTYIYELFNEDKRVGPESGRHWGVLFTNGTAVYDIKLSTSESLDANSSLVFCIARPVPMRPPCRMVLIGLVGRAKLTAGQYSKDSLVICPTHCKTMLLMLTMITIRKCAAPVGPVTFEARVQQLLLILSEFEHRGRAISASSVWTHRSILRKSTKSRPSWYSICFVCCSDFVRSMWNTL